VGEAKAILKTLKEVTKDVGNKSFDPAKPKGEGSSKAKHLVIKRNIENVDYEEARREILADKVETPVLPAALKPDVLLKDHQKIGVAWLEHLFDKSPAHCRGAVLADDMGLGKTLQILTFLAWAFERDPSLPPALIVAPVSLLENWEEEAKKFIKEGALSLLTAYGDALSGLRVPRESIDAQLRADGLVKFLQPGWRGTANVVLTTYETLRDLEFSFGAEKWSVMVCDEAQRIKNPNAMVTRAAKKQNVTFKIACTGTPVENTLTDLWCLFDFVQPGLLGALNDFGRRYRRPIEAETEEEKARVEELRARIAPQILRRIKKEVAKDLPARHDPPVRIPLSDDQRRFYAQAIEVFRKRNDSDAAKPFKNHLGLLHYLRLICTDPRPVGQSVFRPEPLAQYRLRSPKLHWLLGTLHDIRSAKNPKDERDIGEKVIIFCEFREIQRLLRHYIAEEFGFAPDIINGDTAASAKNADSRQKRIKAFQAKPGFGVIILSPVAVGFGVNIQRANHVVHYTRHWNPAKEDQATDRAHRIGQEKEVTVYCPIVEAKDFTTFDVKLDRLLRVKRALAEDMLNGAGDVLPADFALDDMVPGGAVASGLSAPLTIDDVCGMEWEHFEFFVAALWQKKGFRLVFKTPRQDGGVDVVAIIGESGDLIQCKSSATDGRELGWDAVKDVVAGAAGYSRSHPGVKFQKVCVTNQYFNGSAMEQARLNGVEIVDRDNLADLLNRHPITALDVERLKFAAWDAVA
jgi:SNF2 family DNA or RNA helicase